MILRDVLIRGGVAFLEPNSVEMKGYQTEDREVNQDRDFVRGLRVRMR
jgi:RecQ-mediated genome instability protein 1